MNIYREGGEGFPGEFKEGVPPGEETDELTIETKEPLTEKSGKESTEKWRKEGLLKQAAAITGAAGEVIREALGVKPKEGVPKKPETIKPQSEIERKTTKPKEEHPEFG